MVLIQAHCHGHCENYLFIAALITQKQDTSVHGPHWVRNRAQIRSNVRPQSKFMVLLLHLVMCMASKTLLCHYSNSWPITLAPSHFSRW